MSCWARGVQMTHAGHAATGAPAQPGRPVAAPNKCPICGWFTTRSGACVNPDCGERAQALQAVGAGAQPAPASHITHHTPWVSIPWRGGQTTVSVMMDAAASAYVRTVGIPKSAVEAALAQTQPQVWMYLSRCPYCGAWVKSDIGRCRNPRCPKGRDNAEVLPSGPAWTWPPVEINLQHIQTGLSGQGASPPDTHAAWHARAAELCSVLPQSSDPGGMATRLEQLRRCIGEGVAAGWLDDGAPAFDVDVHRALSEAIDSLVSGDPRRMIAALRGDWAALAVQSDALYADLLNPLVAAAARQTAQHQADLALLGLGPKRRTTVAHAMLQATESCLAKGHLPALPPRDMLDVERQALLDGLHSLHPFLQDPRRPAVPHRCPSPAAEAYLWLSKARATPDQALTDLQQERAGGALQAAADELGYGVLSDDQVIAVLDNGWSPAEARYAFRRQARAQRRIQQAVADAAGKPHGYLAAGQILRDEVARLRADPMTFNGAGEGRDPGNTRLWLDPLELPDLSDDELQQLIEGAEYSLVALATPAGQRRWLTEMCRHGQLPHLLTLPDHDRVRRILAGAMAAQIGDADLHWTDIGYNADANHVAIKKNGRWRHFRCRIEPSPDGPSVLVEHWRNAT